MKREIRHILNQLAHGHHIKVVLGEAGLRASLVSPVRRGAGRHGDRTYVPLELDLVYELQKKKLIKPWRGEPGVWIKTVLIRSEQRRLQEKQKRSELQKLEWQRHRRERPLFNDLYYRESPEHKWKLYNDKPFNQNEQGRAWHIKDKLKRAKKTKHWQTVVVVGGKDIREPVVAQQLLATYSERQKDIL
jgi:RNA-binding protein YhbY